MTNSILQFISGFDRSAIIGINTIFVDENGYQNRTVPSYTKNCNMPEFFAARPSAVLWWEGKATYLYLSWDTFRCDLGLLREAFIEINLISSVSHVLALVIPFPEILTLGEERREN